MHQLSSGDVMNEADNFQLGTIFAGRYRIVRRIAVGGMGAVYEVVHLDTDRRRALKVMHANLFQSKEWRERFQREAKVAAHIESEFIVDVFDAGIDESTGTPFLVMELLRGEELGERLKREGKLDPVEALGYLRQIALALEKTHQASIVHRDLKPANIFLVERSEGGRSVKILDFGIAKMVAEGATATGATQSLGTPQYMAPEQLNPHARLSSAADIYALGMMTYTLLVGASYWLEEARGGNMYALLAVASHGPVEPATTRASRLGVTLPSSFDPWFARATACIPTHRFQSAVEAIQALDDVFPRAGTQQPDRSSLSKRPMESGTMNLELALHEPTLPTAQSRQMSQSSTALIPSRPPTPTTPSMQLADLTIGGASTTASGLPKRTRIVPIVAGTIVVIAGGIAGFAKITHQDATATSSLSFTSSTPISSVVIAPRTSTTATPNASFAIVDHAKLESTATTKTPAVVPSTQTFKKPPKAAPTTTSIHTWD
jgi:eukaryotic-like serine/threonine-protein kinase